MGGYILLITKFSIIDYRMEWIVPETDNPEIQKTIAVTVITLIVALFAPVGLTLFSHPYGDFAANLIGAFWVVFIGSPVIPINGGEGIPPLLNPTAGIMALPLIALRLLFVFQIYRAYNNQTSRGSAIILGVLSELYLVVFNVPSYISLIMGLSIGELYLPLPILLLVGALLLWIFPPFVPSKPWEGPSESYKTSEPSMPDDN